MTPPSVRGSVLIAAYFVVASLLLLSIPQGMRSLHTLQLAGREVDGRRFQQLLDAGVDDALRRIDTYYPDLEFGDLGDNGTVGDPNLAGLPCPDDVTQWDCDEPTVNGLDPYTLPGGTYRFRARDEHATIGIKHHTFYRRLRVTATSAPTGETGSIEAMVKVRRPFSRVQGRDQVRVQRNALVSAARTSGGHVDEAIDILRPAASGQVLLEYQFTPDSPSQVRGQVTLSGPGPDLCCSPGEPIQINGTSRIATSDGITTTATATGIVEPTTDPYRPKYRSGPAPAVDAATTPPGVCWPGSATDLDLTASEDWCYTSSGLITCERTYPGPPSDLIAPDGAVQYCLNSLKIRGGYDLRLMGPPEGVRLYVKGDAGGGDPGFPASIKMLTGSSITAFDGTTDQSEVGFVCGRNRQVPLTIVVDGPDALTSNSAYFDADTTVCASVFAPHQGAQIKVLQGAKIWPDHWGHTGVPGYLFAWVVNLGPGSEVAFGLRGGASNWHENPLLTVRSTLMGMRRCPPTGC